ncbi:MAG: hypothetical protein BME93_06020 [Methanosarcinales archaeon Met12]|nr:MAG: hypothetical protein BME93_06020 [Methanosarcinales archaeon Met12]
MEVIYHPEMKRPVRVATWDDIEHIVKKDLQEEKEFYKKLSRM